MNNDLSTQLHSKKKSPWPDFPLRIGLYELKRLKVTDAKIEELMRLPFGTMGFHIYDSRNVCRKHCTLI